MPRCTVLAVLLLPCLVPAAEERWSGLAPVGADLVYAAPAEAGSAGMFGHVLLRIRGAHGEVAVGYAADIGDADGPLTLAWKGLTGGYRARYEIMPWQQELKGYQQTEGRPVWIYPLRLDEPALERLLARLADEQGRSRPYHLITGNCAAGIAEAVAAARPDAAMDGCASPAAVVRAACAAGLVETGQRLPGPGSDRFRPEDDAPAARLTLGGGYDGVEGFASLALRPAWHAGDDPRGTVALGDALEVLAAEVRWQGVAERLVLHRARLIDAAGLAVRPGRATGWAWRAALGSRRERRGADGEADQQFGVDGGCGAGWAPQADVLIWTLASVDARLVDDLGRPAAGAGAEAGALCSLGALLADVRGRVRWWAGGVEGREAGVRVGLTGALTRDQAVRVAGGWCEAWGWEGAEVAASWQLCF